VIHPCTCGHRHPMGLFGNSTGDIMDPPRVAPVPRCPDRVVVPSLTRPGESFTANCPCDHYVPSDKAVSVDAKADDGEWGGDPLC
jgi:hypothetical protein